jgi:integrase
MVAIKLKHVERFKDRYENIRYYYRIGKGPRIALTGDPGSDDFNASYAAASGKAKTAAYSNDRTFNELARLYYASIRFKNLKPSSKSIISGIINRFLLEHGHRRVDQMTMQHVDMIIAAKAKTPAAANDLLKVIRGLNRYAIRPLGWITFDPTFEAEKFKGGSHHTWTEAEISQYEKHWPLGCRERAAFDLFLYTGQRISDVCLMEPSDIIGLLISVAQEKGDDERKDEKLLIPMHSNLVASLNLWFEVRTGDVLICKRNGRAYSVGSFGVMMANAIALAGLPDRCVTHGLRKAAARRLAEAGCSASQIAAITGHKSLREVERYTKAANQGLLAEQAMESLKAFKKA